MKLLRELNEATNRSVEQIVADWAEIFMDYVGQGNGRMEDAADRELDELFRDAKKAGTNPEDIGKEMEAYIKGSDGWEINDVKRTNNLAKEVFGTKLISLARIEDEL